MDLFREELQHLAAQELTARRSAEVAELRARWLAFWGWQGPEVGGRCEVGCCIVWSLTHGHDRYHMMAPCRILDISPDGLTVTAEVDYPANAANGCAERYNGEQLRLDIAEVAPPRGLIRRLRQTQPGERNDNVE